MVLDDENDDIGDFKIAKKSKENKETKKEIKKEIKKETKKKIRHEKSKKSSKSPKYDYKSLQIENPDTFDYSTLN